MKLQSLLCCLMLVSVLAPGAEEIPKVKTFATLGKYKNVEVIRVSWRGVEIGHASGACRVTEADLSPEECEKLAPELARYHRYLKAHDERAKRHTAQVTEALKELKNYTAPADALLFLEGVAAKTPLAANRAALAGAIRTAYKKKVAADTQAAKVRDAAWAKRKKEEAELISSLEAERQSAEDSATEERKKGQGERKAARLKEAKEKEKKESKLKSNKDKDKGRKDSKSKDTDKDKDAGKEDAAPDAEEAEKQ